MENRERLDSLFESSIQGHTMRDLECGSTMIRAFVRKLCETDPKVAELLKQYTIAMADSFGLTDKEAADTVSFGICFAEYQELFQKEFGIPLMPNADGTYSPYLN